MKATHVRNALWLATAAVGFASVPGWRFAAKESSLAPRSLPGGVPELRHAIPDSVKSSAAYIATHDPFRPDHHPAAVPYRPELSSDGASSAPLPPPKAPKPRLAVAGIVGGPPWSALLDSVPGREGSVLVRKGDTLGGLRVRSVGRDTVIIQGADTVWKLIVRRAWQ